jgi:NAD(P)-dependent dehydrogenase (short-subunit alcohol dehydrogenase family)
MIRFDGQVALITGSGRGLGEAYARLLTERGARVVVHDARVTLQGQGFDASVAESVVKKITNADGGARLPASRIWRHAWAADVWLNARWNILADWIFWSATRAGLIALR